MIVLTGESASGKSSIVKYLVDNFNFKSIVPYTTRPRRSGEIDDIDYHFISSWDFAIRKQINFFAETTHYNNWGYGSAREDYLNSKMKIGILSPYGIRQIKNNEIDIYTIYIKVPRKDRLIKILQRGDDVDEAYRRNLSDAGQFDGVEDEVDLIIENAGYEKSIKEIALEIVLKYKELNAKFDKNENQ